MKLGRLVPLLLRQPVSTPPISQVFPYEQDGDMFWFSKIATIDYSSKNMSKQCHLHHHHHHCQQIVPQNQTEAMLQLSSHPLEAATTPDGRVCFHSFPRIIHFAPLSILLRLSTIKFYTTRTFCIAMQVRCTLIPGDGVGPEVSDAVQTVLQVTP